PNLSDEAIELYEVSLESDPIVAIAADNGAVLLDGSDPRFEWVEVEGARDPGLVPPDEQPQITQSDYVFNANDSFWVPHATALLEGDYSPLHGRQRTPLSPRTRENAVVLDDMSPAGASGEDGRFTLDELADAALANRGYTSRALLGEVVARRRAARGARAAARRGRGPGPARGRDRRVGRLRRAGVLGRRLRRRPRRAGGLARADGPLRPGGAGRGRAAVGRALRPDPAGHDAE